MRFYRLAADQGYALAQTNLGICYSTGLGVTQSHTEAVRYFRLAVAKGEGLGLTSLGKCYFNGHGVVKDDKEALRLFHLAAEMEICMHANAYSICIKMALER